MKARERSIVSKNNILNLILAFVLVASVIFYFFSQKNKDKAKESIQYNLASKEAPSSEEEAKKAELVGKYSEEVTFDKPVDVVWEGEIITSFVSGTDYGIKKIPKDKDFPYFYAYTGDEVATWLEGNVEVKGKWTGITCAYQNTVFGRCVPDVEVEEITESSGTNSNDKPEDYSFADFPSPFPLYKGEIGKLNFESNTKASLFKSRLGDGIKEGANFAGRFNITTWGCGTDCRQLAVINVINGDVYFPFDSLQDYKQENGSIIGAEDISYNIDSNLLIIRPLSTPEGYNDNSGDNSWITETKYYLWEYNRFVEIKEDRIGMLLYDKVEETKKLPFTSLWEEKPIEIKEAVGKVFELPSGYNIAISKDYKGKDNENFKVLALSRFTYDKKYNPENMMKRELGETNFDDFIENCSFSDPSLLVIVDEYNIIRYFSVLPASCLFPETAQGLDLQSKRAESLEFLDMNNDGINEILVETYIPAVTDWLYKLNVFSFNPKENEFSLATVDKAFNSNYKNAYRVISRKGRFFIAEADAGVAECHMCDSVYTINVYEFNFYPDISSKDGYFYEVATIVSEKELETGSEALDNKMGDINKKIDNLDEFK